METRPRFLDYLLMLAGAALSILLADLSGFSARPPEATSSAMVSALVRTFPPLLFLGVGIVLLWPVFYMNQRILGRKEDLTWGEWLWGLAWLGYLALTGWIGWKGTGAAPEAVNTGFMTGFVLFSLSMGALAILLFVVGLVTRKAFPWTHTFGLALLSWPLVPLTAWWLSGLKLE